MDCPQGDSVSGINGDLLVSLCQCWACQDCCCQSPSPCSKPLLTLVSMKTLKLLSGVWLSVLWGSLLPSLVDPGATGFCLSSQSFSVSRAWGLILNVIVPFIWFFCSFFTHGHGVTFSDKLILLLMGVQHQLWFGFLIGEKMSTHPSTTSP